jgi:hypothetical protein
VRRSFESVLAVCLLLAVMASSASGAAAPTTTSSTSTTTTAAGPETNASATVPGTLSSLLRRHRISTQQYHRYLNQWVGNLREEGHLKGWDQQQLADVTSQLHDLAVAKQMTAARLPVLFLTLKRNAEYFESGQTVQLVTATDVSQSWATGRKLVYADRIAFPNSELEWEFYPGFGLQLQVLGTFGEANGFSELPAGAGHQQLEQVLNEMESLAVPRAGGIAWEYYFDWEGGAPPWVSAMAQATGIEALTNGYLASGNAGYLTEAHNALPLLETPPPTGVEVTTPLGARFLQYSFAPKTDIINAFLQTLIGLYDYEQVSHDPTALTLFNLGNAQAQSELPSFVVNGWSLYQPGQLDNLNYHELVTGFAQSLCKKLNVPVYCNTYTTFESDLNTHPTLAQVTTQASANKKFQLKFELSKPAYVGITLSQGSKNYIYTKIEFRSGIQYFKAPKLKAGTYNLAMSATDLVGHYVKLTSEVQVCNGTCSGPGPVPVTTGTTTTSTSTTTTGTGTTPTTTTTSTTSPTTTATTPTTTTGTTTTGGTGL